MKNPIANWIDKKVNEKLQAAIENNVQLRSFTEKGYADSDTEHSPEARPDFPFTYRNYIWIFAAIRAIAVNGAKVPLRIYKLKKNNQLGEEVFEGRIWNLFNRPNPYQSYFDLIEAALSSGEISGNMYFEKGGDSPTLAPRQLYVLRPDYVEALPSTSQLYSGYIYKVNGSYVKYEANEICHIKYYNPLSELYGQSPIYPSQSSTILDFYIKKYQKNFFKQGGMISTYVTVPKSLSDAEYQRLKEQLRANYSGVDNAHVLGVFDGDAELKSIATDPQKFLLKEQRMMNREEILAAFGVPPIMLGLLDNATYNNAKEQKVTFWQNTMIPKLQKLQDRFNKEFCFNLGHECRFDLETVDALQEDKAQKAVTATSVVNAGILTPNEAREDFYGKEPINGGDTLRNNTSSNLPYNIPSGNQEKSVSGSIPSTIESTTEEAGISQSAVTLNGAQISSAIQVIQEVIAGRIPKVAGTELVVAVGIPRDKVEQMIEESLQMEPPALSPEVPLQKVNKENNFDKTYGKQMNAYFQIVKKVFSDMSKVISSRAKKHFPSSGNVPLQKNPFVNAAFNNLDEETIGMMDDLISLHEDTMYETYRKEYERIHKTPVPAKIKKEAQVKIKKQAEQWAKKSKDSIVKTMKDRVTKFMDNAIEKDMDIMDVTDGIQDIFTGDEREEFPHARMIARTETSRAVNSGKMEAMKDAGIKYKQWIAGRGENERPDHTALEELGVVPIDYVYETDHGQIRFPGDPQANVADLVNCRCAITEILEAPDEED